MQQAAATSHNLACGAVGGHLRACMPAASILFRVLTPVLKPTHISWPHSNITNTLGSCGCCVVHPRLVGAQHRLFCWRMARPSGGCYTNGKHARAYTALWLCQPPQHCQKQHALRGGTASKAIQRQRAGTPTRLTHIQTTVLTR